MGLTRGTTAGHIARAALGGVAHHVGDVVEAMKKDTDLDILKLRVDGGAASNRAEHATFRHRVSPVPLGLGARPGPAVEDAVNPRPLAGHRSTRTPRTGRPA